MADVMKFLYPAIIHYFFAFPSHAAVVRYFYEVKIYGIQSPVKGVSPSGTRIIARRTSFLLNLELCLYLLVFHAIEIS